MDPPLAFLQADRVPSMAVPAHHLVHILTGSIFVLVKTFSAVVCFFAVVFSPMTALTTPLHK